MWVGPTRRHPPKFQNGLFRYQHSYLTYKTVSQETWNLHENGVTCGEFPTHRKNLIKHWARSITTWINTTPGTSSSLPGVCRHQKGLPDMGTPELSNPFPWSDQGTVEQPQLTVLLAVWHLGTGVSGYGGQYLENDIWFQIIYGNVLVNIRATCGTWWWASW